MGTPLSTVPIYRIDFLNRSEKAIHDKLVSLTKEMMTVTSDEAGKLRQEIDAYVLKLYRLKSNDIML